MGGIFYDHTVAFLRKGILTLLSFWDPTCVTDQFIFSSPIPLIRTLLLPCTRAYSGLLKREAKRASFGLTVWHSFLFIVGHSSHINRKNISACILSNNSISSHIFTINMAFVIDRLSELFIHPFRLPFI